MWADTPGWRRNASDGLKSIHDFVHDQTQEYPRTIFKYQVQTSHQPLFPNLWSLAQLHRPPKSSAVHALLSRPFQYGFLFPSNSYSRTRQDGRKSTMEIGSQEHHARAKRLSVSHTEVLVILGQFGPCQACHCFKVNLAQRTKTNSPIAHIKGLPADADQRSLVGGNQPYNILA